MKRKSFQRELPVCASAFNLVIEQADDPWRLERETWERSERERLGREYAAKMQLTLAQCPGFVGCDPPSSDASKGRVVIEPGHVMEAMLWLKRRFHVSENLDLSPDHGLCIDLAPRVRSCKAGGKRVKVSFKPTEQFALNFTETENINP
jgi:hypothetical protein